MSISITTETLIWVNIISRQFLTPVRLYAVQPCSFWFGPPTRTERIPSPNYNRKWAAQCSGSSHAHCSIKLFCNFRVFSFICWISAGYLHTGFSPFSLQVTELSSLVEQLVSDQQTLNAKLEELLENQNADPSAHHPENVKPVQTAESGVQTEDPPFRPLFPVGKWIHFAQPSNFLSKQVKLRTEQFAVQGVFNTGTKRFSHPNIRFVKNRHLYQRSHMAVIESTS